MSEIGNTAVLINCYRYVPEGTKNPKEDCIIIEVRSDRITWYTAQGIQIKTVQGLHIRNSHMLDNRYLYTLQNAQKEKILTEANAMKNEQQVYDFNDFKTSGIFIYDLQ